MLGDNLIYSIIYIIVFLFYLVISEGEYFKREHSLIKPYQGKYKGRQFLFFFKEKKKLLEKNAKENLVILNSPITITNHYQFFYSNL